MTEFKRTIIIKDKEHFNEAMEFSRLNAKEKQSSLEDKICQLLLQGFDADELVLYKDSVPHSFKFELRRNGDRVYNGGIICHGQGVETFSIELSPKEGIYWSIDT